MEMQNEVNGSRETSIFDWCSISKAEVSSDDKMLSRDLLVEICSCRRTWKIGRFNVHFAAWDAVDLSKRLPERSCPWLASPSNLTIAFIEFVRFPIPCNREIEMAVVSRWWKNVPANHAACSIQPIDFVCTRCFTDRIESMHSLNWNRDGNPSSTIFGCHCLFTACLA